MRAKKSIKKPVAKKVAPARVGVRKMTEPAPVKKSNAWSVSVFIYWVIILFFIAATFYIIGRGQEIIKRGPVNNVEIIEEPLLGESDYYAIGREKLLDGDTDGAIADLTVALQSDSPDVDIYILRGEAFMQIGDYASALTDFDTAIQIDPLNAVAYYDRSLLNTRAEDYAAAMTDINNALAANTERPTQILSLRDLYAKRGQLNLWLKNWDGAVADYTNSLAQTTGTVNPTTYADRAEAFTALGKYTDAVNDYMSAVRVISEQIQAAATADEREDLSRRAMAYFERSAALNLNMGNLDSSRTDLESAATIASALGDAESVQRLQGLISEIQ